jgi:hypothetical protein
MAVAADDVGLVKHVMHPAVAGGSMQRSQSPDSCRTGDGDEETLDHAELVHNLCSSTEVATVLLMFRNALNFQNRPLLL